MNHSARITQLFILLVGIFAIQPLISESVTIGYVNVMDDAPVHVAYEAGYYADEDLDAELVRFSSGTDLIKGIVTGRLDVGVLGFTNALAWASRGADLRIVGGAQRGYHSLLVRSGAGITSPAQLSGRSLASQKQGSTADIILENVVFEEFSVEKRDVRMRYVSPAVAVQALAAGAVDGAFLFEPYARIARYTSPVTEIYEVGEHWPFPCMVVITSASAWSENRETIEAVLEAQKRAIGLLEGDPEQAAELIAHYFISDENLDTPQGPIPATRVITEAIEANSFDWRLSPLDLERIRTVESIMLERGIISSAVDLDEIIDLSWQENRE